MPIQKIGSLRKYFLSAVKFVVAAAVIAVLLYTGTLDLGLIGYAFGNPWILGTCLTLLFLGLVLGGLRWWLILKIAGVSFSLVEVLKIQLISAFFSTWLPGAAGGDAARGLYIFRSLEARRTTAVVTVMIDRCFSLFGLIGAATIVIWLSIDLYAHSSEIDFYIVLFVIMIIVGAISAVVVAIGAFYFRFPSWPLPFFQRMRPFGHQLREATKLMIIQWPTLLACAAISIVASSIVVLGIVLLSSTFPFAPDSLVSALAGVIGNLSSAIPLTPGGLGIGEAAFARVVLGFGAPAASYATIYLTFRLLMLLVSLSGAYFWLTRSK